MSKDYAKGYAIGYINAVREFQNMLVFDEDTQTLRLTTLLHWLEDRENYYIDMKSKIQEDKSSD